MVDLPRRLQDSQAMVTYETLCAVGSGFGCGLWRLLQLREELRRTLCD